MKAGRCLSAEGKMSALRRKFPARGPGSTPITEETSVVCPGGASSCPTGATCCLVSKDIYACCPLPNVGLQCSNDVIIFVILKEVKGFLLFECTYKKHACNTSL